MARFKDLCLDTVDQAASVDFWAAALGLDHDPLDPDQPQPLRGTERTQTVWIIQTPEILPVKSRVHVDVHVSDVEELVSLGAQVIDTTHPWTVLRAPDGLELCAFVREQVPAYRLYELGVDCADPEPIARWWADRLDLTPGTEDGVPWWWVEGEHLPFESIVFAPVPEPKRVKNRMHWDVWGTVEEFVDAGATMVLPRGDDREWDVLADPEGNEFCVFLSSDSGEPPASPPR